MSNKWWPSRNRVKKFNCNSSVACVQCTKIKPAIAVDNKKKHVALEIFLWQTTDNVVAGFYKQAPQSARCIWFILRFSKQARRRKQNLQSLQSSKINNLLLLLLLLLFLNDIISV